MAAPLHFFPYAIVASIHSQHRALCLVSLANKVVLQRLDGLCCVSCHSLLAVVANKNGLLRLGDGDTLTTLDDPCQYLPLRFLLSSR